MRHVNNTYFEKNKFLRITSHALIFDIALFLYAEFFLYSVLTRGKMLYQFFSLNWLVFMGPVITFFITWYLGFLASRFSHRIKNKKLAFIPYVVFIWFPISMFIFIDKNLTAISGGAMEGMHHYWSYFGVLIGIIAGNLFGYTEKFSEEGKSVLLIRVQGMMIPSALFFFYLGFYSPGNSTILTFIFFLCVFISFFGLFKLSDKLDDEKDHKISNRYRIFRIYALPLIAVVFFCLWEELFLWGKINGALMANETISAPAMIFYLTLTGIIPIRIIEALQPPFSLLGIITGFISIGYFLYSMITLLNQIF